ncbi:gliotoxin biosynthesis protein [Stagonosporopsis vannaccii]|nr:gliotoxin biosynthesis protein [Stagonosporopsis vannaccii]
MQEPTNHIRARSSTQSGLTMTSTTHTPHASQAGESTAAEPDSSVSCCRKLIGRLSSLRRRRDIRSKRVFAPVPTTSQHRLDASLDEPPLDATAITSSDISAAEEKGKTVLYLAYGSNLCNETFRGVRGIKPLSQVNVVVPSLRLTFDLAGVPYAEPCFANSARRVPDAPVPNPDEPHYHKDRWQKGLVGVVYEVTLSDYAHIIATEGGGASYHDILVDCHVLPSADTVPAHPTTAPFKAHTLFAPTVRPDEARAADRTSRPDPSYAQPSARYLKLITDGAAECDLPAEYQEYLLNIRPYRVTTRKQAAGKALFVAIWLPFIMMIFALSRRLQDDKGRAPKWFQRLTTMIFAGMWLSYDGVFKKVFGDGERTIGDEMDLLTVERPYTDEEPVTGKDAEETGLLRDAIRVLDDVAGQEDADSRSGQSLV